MRYALNPSVDTASHLGTSRRGVVRLELHAALQETAHDVLNTAATLRRRCSIHRCERELRCRSREKPTTLGSGISVAHSSQGSSDAEADCVCRAAVLGGVGAGASAGCHIHTGAVRRRVMSNSSPIPRPPPRPRSPVTERSSIHVSPSSHADRFWFPSVLPPARFLPAVKARTTRGKSSSIQNIQKPNYPNSLDIPPWEANPENTPRARAGFIPAYEVRPPPPDLDMHAPVPVVPQNPQVEMPAQNNPGGVNGTRPARYVE